MNANLLGALIIASALFVSCKSDKKEDPYAKAKTTETSAVKNNGIAITDAEMERGSAIFFDRCAGCHGSSRKGATGPHLLPVKPEGSDKPGTLEFGADGLKAFIVNGTAAGMPEWGGILGEDEIELMTRFLQVDPPPIPPYKME